MERSGKFESRALGWLCHVMSALFLLLVLPTAFAQNNPVQDAKVELVQESILVRDGFMGKNILRGRKIFVNGYLVSLKEFLVSYESQDPEEQNAAYAFLLGVVEATEGKEWCGYRLAKTISILETIHAELKKSEPFRYDERAADVIVMILKERMPCKKER
jgi:hypothetical protein